jgi:hypothetical protein
MARDEQISLAGFRTEPSTSLVSAYISMAIAVTDFAIAIAFTVVAVAVVSVSRAQLSKSVRYFGSESVCKWREPTSLRTAAIELPAV